MNPTTSYVDVLLQISDQVGIVGDLLAQGRVADAKELLNFVVPRILVIQAHINLARVL